MTSEATLEGRIDEISHEIAAISSEARKGRADLLANCAEDAAKYLLVEMPPRNTHFIESSSHLNDLD